MEGWYSHGARGTIWAYEVPEAYMSNNGQGMRCEMVSCSKAAGLVIDPGVLSDIGLSRYFKHNSLALPSIL